MSAERRTSKGKSFKNCGRADAVPAQACQQSCSEQSLEKHFFEMNQLLKTSFLVWVVGGACKITMTWKNRQSCSKPQTVCECSSPSELYLRALQWFLSNFALVKGIPCHLSAPSLGWCLCGGASYTPVNSNGLCHKTGCICFPTKRGTAVVIAAGLHKPSSVTCRICNISFIFL